MGSRGVSAIDVIGWVAFAIVFMYLLLKITGVISSPLTIDLVALISGAFFVGKYAMKIDYFFKDLENIKTDMRALDKECPVFQRRKTKTA